MIRDADADGAPFNRVLARDRGCERGSSADRREDRYRAGPAGGVSRLRLARSQLHPKRQIPTIKAAAASKAARIASGLGVLGPPFPGGPAVGPARAVAVAATASSSSARAVPVAAAAVSISGGNVGVPAGPVGGPEEEASAVEVAAGAVVPALGGVGDVEAEVGLEIAVAVRVGVLVEVAGVTGVGEGPGVGVREAVGVRDGVGLGPGVAVEVRVGVLDGVRVAVGVKVRVGVLVGVRVGVLVALEIEVAEGTGVFVAGGAVTVKVPAKRVRGIVFGTESAAVALARPSVLRPTLALLLTLKVMFATTPSDIGVVLIAAMTSTSLPGDGTLQPMDLPAAWAAAPMVTAKPLHPPLATVRRVLSKVRSKLMMTTSAPGSEARETVTPTPVVPGSPELGATATERVAPGASAPAPDCGQITPTRRPIVRRARNRKSAGLRETLAGDRSSRARLSSRRSVAFMSLRSVEA